MAPNITRANRNLDYYDCDRDHDYGDCYHDYDYGYYCDDDDADGDDYDTNEFDYCASLLTRLPSIRFSAQRTITTFSVSKDWAAGTRSWSSWSKCSTSA